MSFHRFEDLDVWKRSCNLAVYVYEALREARDYGLRDQMQRAAVSIACNIAEGSQRSPKDFQRFVRIAQSSAAELRTQAYIAAKVGLITRDQMQHLVDETDGIGKMLTGLHKSLND